MAGHGRGWPVSVRRVLDLAPAVPLTVFHNLCNWRHCQKGHTGERSSERSSERASAKKRMSKYNGERCCRPNRLVTRGAAETFAKPPEVEREDTSNLNPALIFNRTRIRTTSCVKRNYRSKIAPGHKRSTRAGAGGQTSCPS